MSRLVLWVSLASWSCGVGEASGIISNGAPGTGDSAGAGGDADPGDSATAGDSTSPGDSPSPGDSTSPGDAGGTDTDNPGDPIVDTTAPTAVFIPPSGGTLPSVAFVEIRFSESIAPTSVNVGGAIGAAVTSQSFTARNTSNDTLTLGGPWPVGNNMDLTIAADDLAGNALGTTTATWEVIESPVGSLVAPAPDTILRAATGLVVTFTLPMSSSSLVLGGSLAASADPSFTSSTELHIEPLTSWPASPGESGTLTIDGVGDNGLPMATLELAFTVDPVAPALVAQNPSDGALVPRAPILVVRFGESMIPGAPELSGTLAAAVTSSVWSTTTVDNDTLTFTPDPGGFADGAGTLVIGAGLTDLAGNPLPAALTLSYDVDAIAPTFEDVSPDDGARITAQSLITLVFSESIDTPLITGSLAASVGDASLGTTNVADDTLILTPVGGGWPTGAGTFDIAATDLAGNPTAAPVDLAYTVDAQAPTVLQQTPSNDATIPLARIVSLVFSESMQANPPTLGGTLAASVGSAVWSSTNVSDDTLTVTPVGSGWPNGAGTLTVQAADLAGNTLTTAQVLSYTVDATRPTLANQAPANNATIGPAVNIVLRFSESMSTATLALTGTLAASVGTQAWSTTNVSNDTLTLTPTSTWTSGAGSLTVPAIDAAGNAQASPASLSYTVDATGPTLTASPLTDSVIDWTQVLTLTASENLSTTTSDHTIGGTLTSGATFTVAVSGATLTLTPSPSWAFDSNRTLTVTARDGFGNAGTQLSLSYDVRDGAVYVTTSGSDANPGTRSEPRLTITSALSAADTMYTTGAVRVGQGAYAGPVSIPSGISLVGSYDASWQPTVALSTSLSDSTAGTSSACVSMVAGTSLDSFIITGSHSTTATSYGVSISINGTAPIVVSHNDITGGNTSGSYALHAAGSGSGNRTLSIDDNMLTGGGAGSTATSWGLYVIRAATTLALDVDGNQVYGGTATTTSGGATLGGASVSATGNVFVGGAARNTYGLAHSDGTMTLTDNFIDGGTAQAATSGIVSFGLDLQSSGAAVINRNAIQGGVPASVAANTTQNFGIRASTSSNVTLTNNLVASGGSTLSNNSYAIDAHGALTLLNNTIMQSRGTFGIGVALDTSGARIENNIFVFRDYRSGNRVAAIWERASTSDQDNPATVKNNLFYDFGSDVGAFAVLGYMNYVGGTTGTCTPAAPWADCHSLSATNLNDETKTTGGAAGTADGNVVTNPSFTNLLGSDGLSQTVWNTMTEALECDWHPAASAARTGGLDGAVQLPPYGFTDDYATVTRTNDGAGTGWCIGAYEVN